MCSHEKVLSLACIIAAFLTGCNASLYKQAVSDYEEHNYSEAIEGFRELGDYKDSADLLIESENALAYEQAVSDLQDQNFAAAVKAFKELGDYKDSADRFVETEEAFCAHTDEKGKTGDCIEIIRELQSTDAFSDTMVERVLVACGKWTSAQYAEKKLKQKLKSPRSYYRYKATVEAPIPMGNDEYTVNVFLDYGDTNSFGGEVRNQKYCVVHFRIDKEEKEAIFTQCIGI